MIRSWETNDSVVEFKTEHLYDIPSSGKLLRKTITTTVDGTVTDTDVLDFFYDTNGRPYAFNYNGTVYYYVLNLQGDVIRLVNESGTTLQSYSYNAWGELTNTVSSKVGKANPLRYRGYYYDTELGMYYLQTRYYDPVICRFINADSFTSTGQGFLGHNMFAYCGNSPVLTFDPTGEWTWVGAVLGGVTSAVGAVMSGESLGDILLQTAIGFFSGGCQSVVASLAWMFVESAYTILTSDESDPIHLSLLVSVFSSQINGDNLNWILKGCLDTETINMFDWVFGTGVDLCAAGIDALISNSYTDDTAEEKDISARSHNNSGKPASNPIKRNRKKQQRSPGSTRTTTYACFN